MGKETTDSADTAAQEPPVERTEDDDIQDLPDEDDDTEALYQLFGE